MKNDRKASEIYSKWDSGYYAYRVVEEALVFWYQTCQITAKVSHFALTTYVGVIFFDWWTIAY